MMKSCRVQQVLWLAVAVVFLIFPHVARAQQADQGLPAAQIIEILQGNPDLLAEAKQEIVSKLRDRGYSVTEADITDDRLFSQIQSDDRVRLALSAELKARGYGQEETSPDQEQPVGQKPAMGTSPAAGGNGASGTLPKIIPGASVGPEGQLEKERDKKQPGLTGGRPRPAEVSGPDKNKGEAQKSYIYRNLPALQDLYTQSLIDPTKLERFGAALFRNSVVTDKTAADIPVSSDYILGVGDQLSVEYYGSVTQKLQLSVDREGRVILPDAGAVLVAGRTLAEAQQLIRNALVRQYKNLSVDVSLGRLKTVRVYVVGDVKNPGAYETNGLSTVLSALLLAGGPTDTGSLRTVKHFRGRRLVAEIDLYDLMLKGVTSGVDRLDSGDSILVPPAGAQIVVAGMVRRPAIYEIRDEKTLDEVLQLAGGVPVTGELGKIKVERIQAYERKEMLSVNIPKDGDLQAIEAAIRKFPIQDGDRVTITPILPRSDQTVYLQGHVFRPGKYPYRDGLKAPT